VLCADPDSAVWRWRVDQQYIDFTLVPPGNRPFPHDRIRIREAGTGQLGDAPGAQVITVFFSNSH
jgi:hypothetical protein